MDDLDKHIRQVRDAQIKHIGNQVSDSFVKGKAAQEGEEREWSGKKYKKTNGKWIPVTGDKKAKKEDDPKDKSPKKPEEGGDKKPAQQGGEKKPSGEDPGIDKHEIAQLTTLKSMMESNPEKAYEIFQSLSPEAQHKVPQDVVNKLVAGSHESPEDVDFDKLGEQDDKGKRLEIAEEWISEYEAETEEKLDEEERLTLLEELSESGTVDELEMIGVDDVADILDVLRGGDEDEDFNEEGGDVDKATDLVAEFEEKFGKLSDKDKDALSDALLDQIEDINEADIDDVIEIADHEGIEGEKAMKDMSEFESKDEFESYLDEMNGSDLQSYAEEMGVKAKGDGRYALHDALMSEFDGAREEKEKDLKSEPKKEEPTEPSTADLKSDLKKLEKKVDRLAGGTSSSYKNREKLEAASKELGELKKKVAKYEKADKKADSGSGDSKSQIKEAEKGSKASGGGYGPFEKTGKNSWKDSKRGTLMNDDALWSKVGGFDDFKMKGGGKDIKKGFDDYFNSLGKQDSHKGIYDDDFTILGL